VASVEGVHWTVSRDSAAQHVPVKESVVEDDKTCTGDEEKHDENEGANSESILTGKKLAIVFVAMVLSVFLVALEYVCLSSPNYSSTTDITYPLHLTVPRF
jgi:hypothetical protein